MKVTQKGQITIPHKFRKRYGFTRDRELVFEATEEGVLLRAAPEEGSVRLRKALASIRGVADRDLSTDQVMKITRG